MLQRALGNTGYTVSAVTYGGIVSMEDGQSASDRYVAWAVERGVNYFDVAPSYGDAQEKLGNSLKPYRQNVYLACKTGERRRAQAEPEMLTSLQMLHTDHFDVYQLHGISSLEEVEIAFGPGGTMEMLREMKEKGIARKLGITAHSEEAALRAMELFDFDTVLFPLNWRLHMEKQMGERLCRTAKARGMGLLSMKSLVERAWHEDERAGSRFPKSWCKPIDAEEVDFRLAAMRCALSLGADTLIPPGNYECFSFMVEHVDECLHKPLSAAERALLTEKMRLPGSEAFF